MNITKVLGVIAGGHNLAQHRSPSEPYAPLQRPPCPSLAQPLIFVPP